MSMAAVRHAAARKRSERLEEKRAAREAELNRNIQVWFSFDKTKTGELNKDELRALLTHLEPRKTISDMHIDILFDAMNTHPGSRSKR